VINFGSSSSPAVDLTCGYNLVADGSGGFGFDFAIGGAVAEPSTWTMMPIGFAGLGCGGYRRSRTVQAEGPLLERTVPSNKREEPQGGARPAHRP
jgi:hypothetical protein